MRVLRVSSTYLMWLCATFLVDHYLPKDAGRLLGTPQERAALTPCASIAPARRTVSGR
jgi:hypothetical protein